MSFIMRHALSLREDERGIAVTSEYVLLLGISMLVFMAIFIGFNSFYNTASGDAMSAAAYRVAAYVSGRVSDAAMGGGSVSTAIEVPGRICGRPYIIYPSLDGGAICVLVGGDERKAPIVANIRIKGFMASLPDSHRIDYDAYSKTLTLV